MALYAVRHANWPTFTPRPTVNRFKEHPNQWPVVAIVQANDLEHAYQLTNHIDEDWTQGPAVQWLQADPEGHRSTSVGDIIVDPSGLAYAVANVGYTLVAHLEPPAVPVEPEFA
jgi:hypothetical protein